MSSRAPEDTPNYQGGGVEKECKQCGATFMVKVARKRESAFCDRNCMATWYSENLTGENSPAWDGGFDGWYGPNWLQQREKAHKRDQYRCQWCRDTAKDLGEAPCAHHIWPVSWFKENCDSDEWWLEANDLSNLICLCRSCHQHCEGWFLRPDTR